MSLPRLARIVVGLALSIGPAIGILVLALGV